MATIENKATFCKKQAKIEGKNSNLDKKHKIEIKEKGKKLLRRS